ncbi:MAG: 16S rRNA (adenine(1518)-N(6)/adenine(1519)-N(6))-dimethyltransferase RsmA [Candidatus Falkowbacteria bacterium]
MTLAQKTIELCKMFEIKPSRSKGQNFLINEKIYDEIVEAASINSEDTVLEVGPGLGFLTAKLAKVAKQVVAVELDDKLANFLQIGLDSQDVTNVSVVNQDVLKFNPTDLPKNYKVVANLPYNITSIFLRTFLNQKNRPQSLVLMLQKEVAERLVAQPGDMSMLALSVQFFGDVEIIREVKAGNFWPEPKIDSAVIRLIIRETKRGDISVDEEKAFFRLAKFGFSAKRKMLKNNLASGLKISNLQAEKLLESVGLDAKVRAEDLSVDNWQKLFAAARPSVL